MLSNPFLRYLNKIGQYFEGDESNATLPITTKELIIEGIFDGGVGVSIINKCCWESMGRPHLGNSNIVVKLYSPCGLPEMQHCWLSQVIS